MGCRSSICVFYKGRFVIAQYAQDDGYPEGEGFAILKFLVDSANIERLKNGLPYIYIVSEQMVQMLRNEAENCSIPLKWGESPMSRLWPSLSRATGAGILELVAQATTEDRLPIDLCPDFAFDDDCEWAYVVDLDDCVFEVYSGRTKKTTATSKRFDEVGGEQERVPWLVKSFSFDELTTEEEFIKALNLPLL